MRRDFARLAETGRRARARRVGGDAGSPTAPATRGAGDPLFRRSATTLNVAAKRAIARARSSCASDGDAIIINGGTTTFQMGEYLRERRLKVLTNSYPLAEMLIHETESRVALPGGEVYRDQKLIVSPFEDDAIQHYSAARMFMSAISIGPLGVIEGDPLDRARRGASCSSAPTKLVVLADSSKFTPRGSLVVCPLSRVATPDHRRGRAAEAGASTCSATPASRSIVVEVGAESDAAA